MGINFNINKELKNLSSCYHFYNGTVRRIVSVWGNKNSKPHKIWEDNKLNQNTFIYVVNGDDKAFASFDNCHTWEEINIPFADRMNILYVNDEWYALGRSGIDILFSQEGKEWNSLNKRLQRNATNVVYLNDKFFALDGSILWIYDKYFNALEQKTSTINYINSHNGTNELLCINSNALALNVSTIDIYDFSIKKTLAINSDGSDNLRFASYTAPLYDGKYILSIYDKVSLSTTLYETDCETMSQIDSSFSFQKTSFSEHMSTYKFKNKIIGVGANGDNPTFFYLSDQNKFVNSTKIKDIDSETIPYDICKGFFTDNGDLCLYVGYSGKRYITYDGINWEYNGTSSSSTSRECKSIAHSTNNKYTCLNKI